MARTASPENSSFFVRCNFVPSACAVEPTDAEAGTPARSFEATTHELLALVEQAAAGIERGEGTEAALREMSATLLELEAIVERDPGIRMGADDLYEAAAALVAGMSAGSNAAHIRRSRLLKDAGWRLRCRLASAQPSAKAQHLGLS